MNMKTVIDPTIHHAIITQRDNGWVRTHLGGWAEWVGPTPGSFDEAVEMALGGAFDITASPGRPPVVCVAVCRQADDEDRIVYTGLVRRALMGRISDDDFVAYVRATRDTGDVSRLHNCFESPGLPRRVSDAIKLVVARAFAGIGARLRRAEGPDHSALDDATLAKFDRQWSAMADTL
jgi:hypothetical protein